MRLLDEAVAGHGNCSASRLFRDIHGLGLELIGKHGRLKESCLAQPRV